MKASLLTIGLLLATILFVLNVLAFAVGATENNIVRLRNSSAFCKGKFSMIVNSEDTDLIEDEVAFYVIDRKRASSAEKRLLVLKSHRVCGK